MASLVLFCSPWGPNLFGSQVIVVEAECIYRDMPKEFMCLLQ